MAEDTEKRFQNIMNKLFHSPKSSSSSSSRKAIGQKRQYAAMEPNLKGDNIGESLNAAQPPPCRPWDRVDLMRRLATFKSMRWFAKPKAVDAVSCARRGWVNVDIDIIACEVCGARLQFATPSTWHQQQVEKAALVFSLKLDTGHKLLCPWVDNACNESLALFPPMPSSVLVDQYKERSSALLQLSALPLISDSVIRSMKNPQLEYFLKQSLSVECGSGPNNSTLAEYFGTDVEEISCHLYYQAHRLLSLCGWEPRLLPYVVIRDDKPESSGRNNNTTGLSDEVSGEQNNKLSVHISASDESMKDKDDPGALSGTYDPSCTVLDCKLCGASVGLWGFTTIPRPLELVRVVGTTELGGHSNETESSTIVNGRSDISKTSKVARLSMEPATNLTIAGGPPPTKQNFRATISLPVIGRNVRARFSYLSPDAKISDTEGHVVTEGLTENLNDEENRDPQDNGSAPKANGGQSELPSTVCVDTTSDQQMLMNITKETSSDLTSEQMNDAVGDIIETALQKNLTTPSIDKDLKSHSADKMMEFHPVQQHRHFCPWVVSTDTTSPGWLQTLSALQKEKVFSLPHNEASPSSPSLIKVDDPITSIRRLFESPPAKRRKSDSTKNVK
ncbi:hypothetical protein RND81_10G209400 [Saponaria officinalis]|uniref:C3HC-type domain-containing protein n=1 Tax=Saponaria officinalis TaxID=3572 RepID=A0AAW1I5C8_SAPOF